MRPEGREYVMAGDGTHYGWSELNCELGMYQPVGLVILRGIKMGQIPAGMHGACIMEPHTGIVWYKEVIEATAMEIRERKLRWV